MRGTPPLVLLSIPSEKVEDRPRDFAPNAAESVVDPGRVQGGKLTVRYITGRASNSVTWNKRVRGSLASGDVRPSPVLEALALQEAVVSKEPVHSDTLGFKQHMFGLSLFAGSLLSILALLGTILGVCIFLIGVALPFGFF